MSEIIETTVEKITTGLQEFGEELKETFDNQNMSKPTIVPKPNIPADTSNRMMYTN